MRNVFDWAVTMGGFVFLTTVVLFAFNYSEKLEKSRRRALLRFGAWFLAIAGLFSFAASLFAGPWPAGDSWLSLALGLAVLVGAIPMTGWLLQFKRVR